MKTLAWLFGIFVCASYAYGQKTVTIEGYIRNMPDTVRFFCAEMKGNGMDVRPEDQEKMVNGKFKFTREADRTTKMYISLNNTGYTVNRVNIADIPAEELFNAITTPYRGKVVFVDFWATWCGPCKAAMKQSEPVKKDFAGKEIVFLYLAGENSPKGTWEQMIPDIKGEHYRMTDAQWDFICKKFGVNGVPSYMIIAKDGTPTHFQVGFMGAEKMKEMLNKELEK